MCGLPWFSIIVPTYARPRQLVQCLTAIADMDYPHDRFEVIVVDDGSGALTEQAALAFRDRFELKFRTQSHGGPARARNAGALAAETDMLAFTDDDCRPAKDWLNALADGARMHPGQMIGGRVINELPQNIYARTSDVLADLTHKHYNEVAKGTTFLSSNNLALPAAQFRDVGGFDEAFTTAAAEDRDFCDRWLSHGYKMTYMPDAIVYHAHALTLCTFWKQQFNYGRGAYSYRRAKYQRGPGLREPNGRLYLSILSHPFAAGDETLRHRFALGALLYASQVAVGSGFCLEWLGQNARRLIEN